MENYLDKDTAGVVDIDIEQTSILSVDETVSQATAGTGIGTLGKYAVQKATRLSLSLFLHPQHNADLFQHVKDLRVDDKGEAVRLISIFS